MTIQEILEYDIFKVGKYSLSVYEILAALFFMLVGMLAVYLSKKLIYRSKKIDLGKKFAFSQILKYLIIIVVFFLMMKSLGVDISPLLLGSGAILVGLGLGLQNLFLDFISGIIILLDRSIKVGDIIELDGVIGRVEEINMRTTVVTTRDKKSMIFPNSKLTTNKLINFSHDDDVVMFNIEVGVGYETDVRQAAAIMKEVISAKPGVLETPAPFVRLEEFADSSLLLKAYYHSRELFRQPGVKSELRMEILEAFREAGINIPFPIRTLQWEGQESFLKRMGSPKTEIPKPAQKERKSYPNKQEDSQAQDGSLDFE